MSMLKKFFRQDPEKSEKKGDAYFKQGLWGQAKLEYEKALIQWESASPANPDYAARLGGKLQKAKESLAREHKQTAEDLLAQGYHEDAKELLQLALALTQAPEMTASLRDLVLQIEQLEECALLPDAFAPISPQGGGDGADVEPHDDEYFLALCSTLPDDVQAAYVSYGEAFRSGYMALNRGEFDMAVELLSRAAAENPSPDSMIPLELATAHLHMKNFDKARRLLEGFLEHHPDALPGYQVLCEVLWEMGAFDEAEAILAGCPEDLKESLAYHLLRGETMVHAGNTTKAVSFYQDFLKQYGWNESIAGALAMAYELAADFENALDTYTEIMNHCVSCHTRVNPQLKRKIAELSFDLGRHSTAILELFLSLIQEDPGNAPEYYHKVSQIYTALGNEHEARRFRSFAHRTQQERG